MMIEKTVHPAFSDWIDPDCIRCEQCGMLYGYQRDGKGFRYCEDYLEYQAEKNRKLRERAGL